MFEVIYLSLFTISFLAATILPFSSELTLAGLITSSNYDNLLLLIVASLGNVLYGGSNGYLYGTRLSMVN